MRADYVIRQGEDLSLSLIAIEGDIGGITDASAVLKQAGPNGSVPPLSSPPIAVFNVADVEPPELGWTFTLDSEVTADLKPGYYVTNAKLTLAEGGPLKTDAVLIEVRLSVT